MTNENAIEAKYRFESIPDIILSCEKLFMSVSGFGFCIHWVINIMNRGMAPTVFVAIKQINITSKYQYHWLFCAVTHSK